MGGLVCMGGAIKKNRALAGAAVQTISALGLVIHAAHAAHSAHASLRSACCVEIY